MRRFSLEEANATVRRIAPLVDDLLARRERLVSSGRMLGPLLKDIHSNVGGGPASSAARDLLAIERLVDAIRSCGCLLSHSHFGHVDFLTEREGREMYLCWRHGESAVGHVHGLDEGYAARRALPTE